MASINDIARIAGVSASTVSHVVNHTRYVSPELVEKVEKAIQEMEELPNFIVKKTKGKKKSNSENPGKGRFFLLLLSEPESLFQNEVTNNIKKIMPKETFIEAGYDEDEQKLELLRNVLLCSPNLCGVIAFPDQRGVLNAGFFQDIQVPVVLIGKKIKHFEADVLFADTFEGGYRATKHLIKNGHEQIAFLGSSHNFMTSRFEGYKKALEDCGISFHDQIIFRDLNSEEDVYQAMDKIMSMEVAPTAVIAANSSPLMPLMKYTNVHNISIPKELSVVSLNDFQWAPLFDPGITSIDKKPEEFARTAVEILMERMKSAGEPEEYQEITLPAEFNVRGSTCGIGRGPFGEKAENVDALALSEAEKELIRQKNYTAAISFHYTGKAWMQLQEKGIKKIFEDLNISVIAVTDAHFDASLQCKQLESIQFLNPDILIAIPVDAKDTAEAFRTIVQTNIRLVLITNIPDGFTPDDYVSCISVNEHAHGQNMGHGIGEYMIRHNLRHVGLIRHGDQHFFATKQRDDAAKQVLAEEFPDINICGEMDFITEQEVYKKTLGFIKHHPEIEALYVSWDGPALEAMKALIEVNRTDVAVVTGDLDYSIAMNMAKGGMVKMLSTQCPYEQGEAIALAAANSLLGKKAPSFIGVEPVCVNQDNLLKTWKTIFKEEAPAELRSAVRQNPNHILL